VILISPGMIYGKLNYNKGENKDAIVILGYPALKKGAPSPILCERINKGIELYNKNISSKIICTGSAVKNEYIEAEIIRDELLKASVPLKNIICEKNARSTWDNIKYLKNTMKELKMEKVVIVSSPWHLRRAAIYANKFGLNYTVEKSDIPKEIPIILLGIIYIYIYYGINIYMIKEKMKKRGR
jgi:uncharacterized SAM-binding protein YcdF (DUF218 family)